MPRPSRDFRADSFVLEGRRLLSIGHASILVKDYVHFKSTTSPTQPQGSTLPTEELVSQEDGKATVVLLRLDYRGTLQVRVTTDPSSPTVGVNVGSVDQTVTFAKNQNRAVLTVPILAGAANPGEVDVDLYVTPITPNISTSGPLKLRILASDATIPPRIVSVEGKPEGTVLTFSKPMDPVGASNLNNYVLTWTSSHSKYSNLPGATPGYFLYRVAKGFHSTH